MRTNVYVDGFNLYYRALKDTPFRWLDLRKLAETVFPEHDVRRISYFTALLDARPYNPSQPLRQQAYLRALETLPGLDIHYGVFSFGKEKGSDVNLVTRLLVDGFKNEYEQAVVVSNDRDFAGAVQAVRDDLGLHVTLLNPNLWGRAQRHLAGAATYVKNLRESHLRRSLLPDALTDDIGVIRRPPGW